MSGVFEGDRREVSAIDGRHMLFPLHCARPGLNVLRQYSRCAVQTLLRAAQQAVGKDLARGVRVPRIAPPFLHADALLGE